MECIPYKQGQYLIVQKHKYENQEIIIGTPLLLKPQITFKFHQFGPRNTS